MAETTDDSFADVLTEAKERFSYVIEQDKANRDEQRTDTEFVYVPGKQWAEDVRTRRSAWNDPCLEFNQLKQFVHQIVNDQRQNRPGIRVHPNDGKASEEVSEILQGLIRGIEYESSAEAAYDSGYQGAVVGGRGYWRIVSDYATDGGFEQSLCIRQIPDPLSVYPDIDFTMPDGSDMRYCFVTEALPRKEFERRYPDADPDSWDTTDQDWVTDDKVVVADYYRRLCIKKTIVQMSDGSSGPKDDLPKELPLGVSILAERETEEYKVEWYKIAGGNEVLEKHDWPGTYIPVICCMGDTIIVDGKRVFQGAIRMAKPAQQYFNYGMTAQAIHLALTPRAPWVVAEGQIEGYEDVWANANARNYSALPYKPVSIDGTPVPPPMRQPPSTPDAGFFNWCQQTQGLLRNTTGMYENSLGMRGQEQSGRAILAREKQGDNATFHFVDNLSRAIALTGKILVDLIPHYYDTERIVHIIGPDDVRKMVTLNQQLPGVDPLAAIKRNDVTVGEYSVTVETGPSYATKRQEAADSLMQFIQAFPPAAQVAGDLIAGSMDWPDADVIADRLKLGLPPQIQQAEMAKEAGQNPQLMQMQQAMQQQQQQMQQMMQAAQAKMQQLAQENQSLKADRSADMMRARIDAMKAQNDAMADKSESMNRTLETIVGLLETMITASAKAGPGIGPETQAFAPMAQRAVQEIQ